MSNLNSSWAAFSKVKLTLPFFPNSRERHCHPPSHPRQKSERRYGPCLLLPTPTSSFNKSSLVILLKACLPCHFLNLRALHFSLRFLPWSSCLVPSISSPMKARDIFLKSKPDQITVKYHLRIPRIFLDRVHIFPLGTPNQNPLNSWSLLISLGLFPNCPFTHLIHFSLARKRFPEESCNGWHWLSYGYSFSLECFSPSSPCNSRSSSPQACAFPSFPGLGIQIMVPLFGHAGMNAGGCLPLEAIAQGLFSTAPKVSSPHFLWSSFLDHNPPAPAIAPSPRRSHTLTMLSRYHFQTASCLVMKSSCNLYF